MDRLTLVPTGDVVVSGALAFNCVAQMRMLASFDPVKVQFGLPYHPRVQSPYQHVRVPERKVCLPAAVTGWHGHPDTLGIHAVDAVTATGSIGHEASRLHAEPPGHDNMPVRSVLPPGWSGAGVPGGASQGQSPARGAPDPAPQAPQAPP